MVRAQVTVSLRVTLSGPRTRSQSRSRDWSFAHLIPVLAKGALRASVFILMHAWLPGSGAMAGLGGPGRPHQHCCYPHRGRAAKSPWLLLLHWKRWASPAMNHSRA